MWKLNRIVILTLTGVLAVSGCGGDSASRPSSSSGDGHEDVGADGKDAKDGKGHGAPQSGFTALYAPSKGLASIPLPSDVLFAGTPDGSLNIPGTANYNSQASPDTKALDDPLVALNTMDGFGVTTDLWISVEPGARDELTVPRWSAREGVRIYETGQRNPWPVADSKAPRLHVERELIYGADYVLGDAPEGYVGVKFVKPLKPYTTYLVSVNRTSTSDPDNILVADPEYKLLQSTEPFVFRRNTEQLCNYSDVPDSLSDCTDLNPAFRGKLSLKRALVLEGHRQATNAQIQAIVDWDPPDTSTFPDAYPFLITDPPATIDYTSYDDATRNIVLSYSVTTQKAGYGLKQAFNVADGRPLPGIEVSVADVTTEAARFYSGTLSGAVQFLDPDNPHEDIWEAHNNRNLVYVNGMIPEIKRADHAIPILVSVPTGSDCDGELEIAIFQHDILRNRTDLRRVGDALARACSVGVAIDLPKHGVLPGDPDADVFSRGDQERLVREAPGEARCVNDNPPGVDMRGPGKWCASGDGFINGNNLANTRDTIRQAIVDMYSLYRALSGGALIPDELGLPGASFDTDEIHFVGHGYGAALGIPFIANAIPEEGGRRFGTITFNAGPAGGLFRMLDGSPVLDDLLLETIDAPRPSLEWDLTILIGQTLLDSVNDLNAVRDLGLAGPVPPYDQAPILAQEIIGYTSQVCTAGARCPDPVIPNNMYGAQRYGWYYIIDFLGATAELEPGTSPAFLAGTDPITQGTSFIPAYIYLDPHEARALGPLASMEGLDTYFGLGLSEITQAMCDSLAYSRGWSGTGREVAIVDGLDIVRFIRGSHYSLLGTDEWPAVTAYMRDQITEWIASGGTRLVCDPAAWGPNAMLRRE